MGSTEQIEPSFTLLEDGSGIEITDPVERRRFGLFGTSIEDLEVETDDAFAVPVDAVAAFRAARIHLEDVVDVVVRDGEAEMVTEVLNLTEASLPTGEHVVELNGPIKVYLRIESALTINSEIDGVSIEFPEPTRVGIGARSYHRRPAATVTTPADPEAMAMAISSLGSALKTTSPERAYPTLRGHPPAIELGDELRVPAGLSVPDSGVTVEVPPAYEALYAAAPLAYYLGAELAISDQARIVTTTGFVHPLDAIEGGIERGVERVLKQAFLLDCVTRTAGLYRIPLHERAAIEPTVALDFDGLYDEPLHRRLEAYLGVPYETIEPHVPTWNLVAHVPPRADLIEVLPYLVDDLALVRAPDASTLSPSNVREAVLADYFDGHARSKRTTGTSQTVQSRESRSVAVDTGRIIQLAGTEAMEDAWFGDSMPLNATKSHPQAYRHRLERSARGWPISIAVVGNDVGMTEEQPIAESVYGSDQRFPLEVTRHRDLAVDELRAVFDTDVDYLHYIGHTTVDGFRCHDGWLDAATLDDVGVETFFLNSCRSFRHGQQLIEAGSVGGVVTLSDVNERGAGTVGRTMARLLNRGFPLRAALQLAARTSVVGGHYIVVGDGTTDLASAENGIPLVCHVDEADEDRYDLTVEVFLNREGGMGTTVFPLLASNDYHHLAPGNGATFRVSADELRDYLTWHPVPIVLENRLILEEPLDRLDP